MSFCQCFGRALQHKIIILLPWRVPPILIHYNIIMYQFFLLGCLCVHLISLIISLSPQRTLYRPLLIFTTVIIIVKTHSTQAALSISLDLAHLWWIVYCAELVVLYDVMLPCVPDAGVVLFIWNGTLSQKLLFLFHFTDWVFLTVLLKDVRFGIFSVIFWRLVNTSCCSCEG